MLTSTGGEEDTKDEMWEQLSSLTTNHHKLQIILGDLNARLHGRLDDGEEEIMGQHIFGKGRQHVHQMPDNQFFNRQNLVEFCMEQEFVISNTLFDKPPNKLCTHKFPSTEGFKAPWNASRFGQIDYLLINKP